MSGSILMSWLLAPALMLALLTGCGLLVRRLGGRDAVPGALVLPLGFALMMTLAGTVTSFASISAAAPWVLLFVGLLGLVLDWRVVLAFLRRPGVGAWAAGAAFLAFGVVAAPLVLSWTASYTGYARIVDIAHQFALSSYLLEDGRTLIPESYSSATEVIRKVLASGYPGGWQSTLASFGKLLGTDLAWLYQPLLAVTGAMTALGLFTLLGDVIRNPAVRALAAGVASQANILYAYGIAGGFKEMTAAALVALAAGLLAWLLREGRQLRIRDAIPLATAVAGGLTALSVAILPWLGILLLGAFIVSLVRRTGRVAALATWAVAAVIVVLVSLPLLTQFTQLASVAASAEGPGRTAIADLGNLAAPVPVRAAVGLWITPDHRVPAVTTQPQTDVLLVLVLLLALAGFAVQLARRRFILPIAGLAGGIALAYYSTRTGPWIELKAIAITGPLTLTCAFAGAAAAMEALRRRGRVPGLLGAIVPVALAVAVLAGNAVTYHNASIAPVDRLTDLERLGERYAGQGPAFFSSFDEAAEYFLRREDGVGLVNPPAGKAALARPGTKLRGMQYAWDVDDLRPPYVQSYKLLVLRRSPFASRPPSNWELVERTRYHEVWRRTGPASSVLAHVPASPLQDSRPASSCRALTRLAARAAPGSRVAYAEAAAGARWQLPRSSTTRSPNWGLGPTPDTLAVSGPGHASATIRVPEAGEYEVWMGGSFGRRFEVTMDGKRIVDLANRRNYPGQFEPVDRVRLEPGTHRLRATRGGGDLSPGTGSGESAPIGPLALVRETPGAGQVRYAPLSEAGALCRSSRRLDWIEIVRGGGRDPAR